MTGVLDGVTVLDLTVMLAGPYATMMLADQGARVIKIEPPGGDDTRKIGPHPEGGVRYEDGGFGAYFNSINRGKDSVVLNLKSEDGKAVFLRLVEGADILIENYRVGVLDKLGIGYERLAEVNPRLVYGAIRGFGDARTGESPYRQWPAYDVVAQAMGGIMTITGPEPGGPPTKIGPGIGDTIPAMQCVIGVLAAYARALKTGQGAFVDVGMVDGILAVCERMMFQHSYTGADPGPEGNGHPLLCPFGIFPAKDGWVSLGIARDDFFVKLCRLIGRDDMADDPDWALIENRLPKREAVNAIFAAWTGARTKAEIAEILGGVVPFGPVQTASDIATSPHTAARDMLTEVEHPGAGQFAIVNTPVKIAGAMAGVTRRAPLVGEQTDAVLDTLGIAAGDRARLRASGAIA